MKIILIKPAMSEKLSQRNFTTWNIEPLSIAILKSLTPSNIKVSFYDDRIEAVPFEERCDLVGITVDTSTASRAYSISGEFKKRGVPVILGGYHPSLVPEEATRYADSVVIGTAEGVWRRIINDVKNRELKKMYYSKDFSFSGVVPDRNIFKNKKYLPIRLVETSRGCSFSCEFCSTGAIYNGEIVYKKIEDVKREIKDSRRKIIMFADENISVNIDRARELFKSLIPLKIRWVGQGAPNILYDREIISVMRKSGCVGLLVGFESLSKNSLKKMKKNVAVRVDYGELLDTLHSNGIAVYASFIAGYSKEVENIFDAFRFLIRKKVVLAGFSPLTPYPGTPLYCRLLKEGKIYRKDWWLDKPYPYWKFVHFKKEHGDMDSFGEELKALRRKFYSFPFILRRLNFRFLLFNPLYFIMHIFLNFLGLLEVRAKERLFTNE